MLQVIFKKTIAQKTSFPLVWEISFSAIFKVKLKFYTLTTRNDISQTHKEPINLPLSHEGHRRKLQIRASVLERSLWSLCTQEKMDRKTNKGGSWKRDLGERWNGCGTGKQGKWKERWQLETFFLKKSIGFLWQEIKMVKVCSLESRGLKKLGSWKGQFNQ